MTKAKPVVAIAGASGYIGENLISKLKHKVDLIALSRNGHKRKSTESVKWRSCDLFSMADAEKGLQGADIAIYLVHSMMPSAKLTQGTFEDMDVILADNFAQAAKRQGIKEIVYLGGIVPSDDALLSRHLESRLEVERILRAYGTPVTALRAGLIVGPKGSSFPILAKLVKRLPMMILPKWTRTKTQPIALEDVMTSLTSVVLDKAEENRSIDIGGPDVLTYRAMMEETAQVLGKKRLMLNVPFFSLTLSRLWLRLVTQTPKEIVYPLVESLQHEMTVQDAHHVMGISNGKIPFRQAAADAMKTDGKGSKSRKKRVLTPIKQDVRSVQRVALPEGASADWVGRYYVKWLEDLLNPWINTATDADLNCKIGLLGQTTLLEMSYSRERSTQDRALYYITGGLLTDGKKNERGRMEFRQIPGADEVIIAIHDFTPSLPWFVYHYTQANVHLMIMHLYKRHMRKISLNQTVVSMDELSVERT
ncbi:NADH:ubiquinone reductase (H(+)-translocating) [Lentibacillus sp. JNUCC-1]|uniref:NmrA family NAD(P)-binding protein n=1 Tax=Lentibacillus sp. JNUCC-1 TaxID=2654513 RepID=UPI0012E84BC9|nr:NAD(P)H-binding protein [Lentibacillus sp. JNUCC-1]MUV37704.1 NADH:ubiquinone reductase (H(+)-translocating) [Lentibacillus sp. JNUCC-1]